MIWFALACAFQTCDIPAIRKAGWDSALVSIDDRRFSWGPYLDDKLEKQKFRTHAQCMAALKRKYPVRTYTHKDPRIGFKIYTSVKHRKDYIDEYNQTNMFNGMYYACFHGRAGPQAIS